MPRQKIGQVTSAGRGRPGLRELYKLLLMEWGLTDIGTLSGKVFIVGGEAPGTPGLCGSENPGWLWPHESPWIPTRRDHSIPEANFSPPN